MGLLAVFLRLPFEILIPNTLFEDELLSFSDHEKTLLAGGLKVVDLPGSQVSRARDIIRAQPRLSIHDGFAFALAEVNHGCILLTGDSLLRALGKTSDGFQGQAGGHVTAGAGVPAMIVPSTRPTLLTERN